MSRQKTYWASFVDGEIDHLWHRLKEGVSHSDCGYNVGLGVLGKSKGRQCKNCLRAIKR